jgi:GTP-binding protein
VPARLRLVFLAPSRGLIGYPSRFLTDTRGTGVLNRVFHDYEDYRGDIPGRRNGALIASETGTAVAYALFNLQDRGVMFIDPQTPVYQGMIVGEHSRDNDLEINVSEGQEADQCQGRRFGRGGGACAATQDVARGHDGLYRQR